MNKEKISILAHLQAFRAAHPGPFWASLGVACVSMFGMVAAFGTAPSTLDRSVAQQTVVEQLAPAIILTSEKDAGYFVHEDRVQRGDTVASLLARLGVQDEASLRFLRENPAAHAIFRQLRPGKSVTAHVAENGELQTLIYPLNGADRAIFVERRDGKLQVNERALQLETQVQMQTGEIRYSLFGATDDAGIPDSVAMQLTDIFGGDIDFHRDLRRGDRFEVVYEMLSYLGKPVRSGRILAAEFVNNGKSFRAAWFEDITGKGGYYTPEGKSIRKAFLRSPLEFSRISSGFTSARFHPILQKWRAHKGVDYAAPIGTRVKSTSDGIVDFVGNQGGYGRVVILRHQGRYSTVYGHLSGFAPGMRKGGRVSQGDVIGFVGASGWATGPHLHYEFRINDVQQNPLSIALPGALPLTAEQLAQFRTKTQPALARLDLVKGSNLALLD
ncbi:MAG TPA: peptidoglycan DD-metalloendopeptidase family protein [Rhodocyclaceae bacterium]|nr:peptidoglycan DD-metalloendopeptidase family protein [Rhodocyclaceae bacterium]